MNSEKQLSSHMKVAIAMNSLVKRLQTTWSLFVKLHA
jgi:hypothetical protein